MTVPNRIGFVVILSALLPSIGTAQPSYETYYRYINDYPADAELEWGQHPQGAAHDQSNWYITKEHVLYRIPVDQPLLTVNLGDPDIVQKMGIPPVLSGDPNYGPATHYGDPDYYQHKGVGFVLVPLEGASKQAIGVFRADTTLAYVTHFEIAQGHAAWCAVNPKTGELYSAPEYHNASQIFVYTNNWDLLLRETPVLKLELTSAPLINSTVRLQGGEISPDGRLLYLVNTGRQLHSSDTLVQSHIQVYDISENNVPVLIQVSMNGSGLFNFEVEDYFFSLEVAEGLVIWDLDDGRAPNIRGQLHVFMFRHGQGLGDDDDVYLKHYENAIYVDSADRETCQVMCCNDLSPFPCIPVPSCTLCLLDPLAYCETQCSPVPQDGSKGYPFRTVNTAHAAAWSGAKIRLAPGSYPEGVILTKAIKLEADAGPATIGK